MLRTNSVRRKSRALMKPGNRRFLVLVVQVETNGKAALKSQTWRSCESLIGTADVLVGILQIATNPPNWSFLDRKSPPS
jgi:hypothetical protein